MIPPGCRARRPQYSPGTIGVPEERGGKLRHSFRWLVGV
jgi:hypothetical protein